MRVTIISREEEGLERDLPGLYEAMRYCDGLATNMTVDTLNYILERVEEFNGDGVRARQWVRDTLPLTDEATKRAIINATMLFRGAKHVKRTRQAIVATKNSAEQEPNKSIRLNWLKEWEEQHFSHFGKGTVAIRAIAKGINDKIIRFEARRLSIRAEIDAFFGTATN
jgi:hypothetical protein